MKRFGFQTGSGDRRSAGFSPALLGSALLIVAGCGSGEESTPPASLQPPVSAEAQKKAQDLVAEFASDVQKTDDAALDRIASPAFKAKAHPLAGWLKGPYAPLKGAANWQYDLFQYLDQGKKLVVHAHFTGADGNPYRTNLTFVPGGNDWLLDAVLPPSMPKKPGGVGSHVQKAP